mgnify:FL=1
MLAILMAAFSISACNSKPKEKPKPKELPFVTQTEKNLREWIDKNAINPEDFKVSNYKVVWKTDSLCVINFRAIGENGFGGHVRNEFQYLNIRVDGVLYEWCDNKRNGNGVLDAPKDWFKYDIMMGMKDKTLLRLAKNKSKAGKIFTNAYVDVYIDYSLGSGGMSSGNVLDFGKEQVADTIKL